MYHETRMMLHVAMQNAHGEQLSTFHVKTQEYLGVSRLEFSPDGKFLMSSSCYPSYQNSFVKLYDALTGNKLVVLAPQMSSEQAAALGGKTVAGSVAGENNNNVSANVIYQASFRAR